MEERKPTKGRSGILSEITAITVQTKDKTRCSVYVDGRFACGLRVDAALSNRLKVGQEITQERLEEIQMESEKSAAFDKALTHLSATRKTEKEIRAFLGKKGYLPAVADYAVEKLRSYGFLNDGEYAEAYVESAIKKKGGRLIKMELRSKGISEQEIDAALEDLDEETELEAAKTLLQKYMRGKPLDVQTLQKAYRYLMSKGYDYEIAKSALSSMQNCEDD